MRTGNHYTHQSVYAPAALANLKHWIVGLSCVCALVVHPAISGATAPGPQEIIMSTTSTMIQRLKDEQDTLRHNIPRIQHMVEEVLLPHIDLNRASKLVLGKYWRTASNDQRDRFQHEFVNLLMRTYTTALSENVDLAIKQKINYFPLQMQATDTDVIVRTEFNTTTSKPVPVNYRLALQDGVWKVYDVTVGGISLVITYRKTFASEISQGGIDKLIARLTEHNQKRRELAANK